MSPSQPLEFAMALLARIFAADQPRFPPEAARLILTLQFNEEDQQRMHLLSAKAREGALAPGEASEVEAYGLVGSLLAILQSKARRALETPRKARGARQE